MIAEPVISNTTPLIKLAGIGMLDLLPRLYGAVWIPAIVRREYQDGAKMSDPDLDTLSWLQVVPDPGAVSLPAKLGLGEQAVLQLAVAYPARAVLIDERKGRRVAKELGLPILGTLGVLLTAKQAGLISELRPLVDEMIAQGRRIGPVVRARVLSEAGETG